MKKAKNRIKKQDESLNQSIKRVDKSVEILGLSIFGTRKSQVLAKIWLQRKEMLHVATVNPEFVMEARCNPRFRKSLEKCLTVADGHGIVWALRLAQGKLVERISGVELVNQILQHASDHGEKVFLLGAGTGIAQKAAENMVKKYPQLDITWYSGAQTVKLEKNEEASMTIAKINGYEPDYLLVAYGSPWQDIWIEDNRPYLRARVAMGVGGVLDEWAKVVPLCPEWIDQVGLKWMWRVVTQPWRLPRIFKVIEFGLVVLYHKLID